MTRYEKCLEEALKTLEEVDFPMAQLNVVWKERFYVIAETIAEATNNLPWEEWADDGDEE